MSAAEIILGQPEELYHAPELGVLSCSAIKELLRSPAHYRAWLAQKRSKDTPARIFGKALHCAALEPTKFDERFLVLPSDAPRRPSITQRNAKKPSEDTVLAIQYWDRLLRSGKTILDQEDRDRILAMGASVAAHPWARLMLTGGESEVVVRWRDPDTGLPCKLRADYWRRDLRLAFDVKAVRDASPTGFRRAAVDYRYPVQHCHYSRGFAKAGEPLDAFVFLAIENEAPFVCQPYVLDVEAETHGEILRRRGARILKESLEADKWPGYSDDILSLSMPPWALKETEGETIE